MKNSYKTIANNSQGIYKEKGSKFISFAYMVGEEEEIRKIIGQLRKKYHDARHHCYAYRLGRDKKIYRYNDDNEPPNTAGKPIYGQIVSYDLTNILVVVVRYFGGTLLGKGGLIQAYKSAAKDVISKSTIIKHSVKKYYECCFPFDKLSDFEKIMSEENINREQQTFSTGCRIVIAIGPNDHDRIVKRLDQINNLNLTYLYTR